MNKLRCGLTCVFAVAVGTVFQLRAQETTANVTGTVTDSSGSIIAGATVKLGSVALGASRTIATGTDGRFSFRFVPVGNYQLVVSQSGFRDTTRSLQLATGQDLDLTVQLDLAQISQTVEVTSEVVALDTTTSEQRSTLGSSLVNTLPVQHQDWTTLLPLSTGTTIPTPPSLTASASLSHSVGGSGLNVNGLPSGGYSLTIDGTNASQNVEFNAFNAYQSSGLISTVNNDAIAEISLGRGIPPATVGNAMSGSINIVTKSGSNEYHGSLYEQNEVSVYDARNQFLAARPRTTFNNYGGSLGLPIIKNQLFLFAGYEGADLSTSTLVTGPVPSPYLLSIAPAVYSSVLNLFPKVAQPAGNPTATTGEFIGAAPNVKKDDNGMYRIDYYANEHNLIFVRYVRQRPNELIPNLIPSNPRYYDEHGNNINATYTHFGGRWVENTRVAYNHLNLDRYDSGWATGIPTMSFGFSTGGPGVFRSRGAYTTFQEGISFVTGKHTIQFGGIVERNTPSRLQFGTSGFGYSTLTQFLNNTPSSLSLTINDVAPGSVWGAGFYQYGAYIQDDWRASKNLTLNVGLRYDLFTVPQAFGSGQFYNRGVNPADPALGPGFGPFRPLDSYVDGNHLNFQPRIGLAYNLFGAGKTVIRAGFGTFVANRPVITGEITAFRLSPAVPIGVSLNQSLVAASGLQYSPSLVKLSIPAYEQEVTQLQAQGILSPSLSSQVVPENGSNPTSLQWTFGIQQALPWSMTLEVDYNGNRGLHEAFTETLNLPDRVTGVAPSAAIGLPGFGTFGGYEFDDISKYAALQMNLRKSLQHGLQFGAGFTWSKVNTCGQGDILYGPAPQDPYNKCADWGPAPFDVRRRFFAQATWDLPLAKLHSAGSFAGLLLDGWQVSPVFTAQSGLPVDITYSASSYPSDRPDAAGLPASQVYVSGYQSGLHQYINPSAFTLVPISKASSAQVRDGNLGHYAIRAPGLENLNFTLSKSFALTERFRLVLHGDAFNALNHTNLTGLVTTINTPGTFGQLTQATARTMQVGARVTF